MARSVRMLPSRRMEMSFGQGVLQDGLGAFGLSEGDLAGSSFFVESRTFEPEPPTGLRVLETPPVRGKLCRPRRRPSAVLGDRGYDHGKYRRLVWDLGVKPLIVHRGTEHGSGLDTQRWGMERVFARWMSSSTVPSCG